MDDQINCHSCGTGIAAEFQFCPKCGAKQERHCAKCGHVCAADFAFCPKCGSQLNDTDLATEADDNASGESPATVDVARRDADRRPVTVLFADLSGFTALSETMDPEDVRALQNDLHRATRDVIGEFDGFLEKFVGDAVLAVFGAPIAHEDDPERALRTALALMTRVAELSTRWERRVGQPLAMHIGVNTGPVVAGALGVGGDAAYAVTGDTVNTAARLQSAAGGGEIWVGPSTYQLTRHRFPFEPVGEIEMKGKAEPITVHRLSGEPLAMGATRGLATLGLSAPLIGRKRELAQINDAFGDLDTPGTSLVRIVGAPGIGKSRLIDEFLSRADGDIGSKNVTLLRASCSAMTDQTFGILAQLLRNAYGIDHGDDLAAAETKLRAGIAKVSISEDAELLLPYLIHVLGLDPDDGGFAGLPPEQLKRQIFMATRSLFDAWLAAGPVLVLIEDLHWSDLASVEVMRYLLDRIETGRMAMLVTHRPEWDAEPLNTERARQTVVRLESLSTSEVNDLFDAFFGPAAKDMPEDLRQLVIERAGGNPFYMEEIVRSLIDKNVIYQDGDTWSCDTVRDSLDVPMTLQGLLLSRLDGLPERLRDVVQKAAVLGVVFRRDLLATMADGDADIETGLAALCGAEIIETEAGVDGPDQRDRDRRYRFTHAIVQEVAYQNLLLKRRTELHGAAGAALEELCGGQPQNLEDIDALARHFSRSADKTKGIKYLIEAGDWSRRSFAGADAARHYRDALAILDEPGTDSSDRGTVLERLADMLGLLGARDEALTHYQAVLDISAANDDGSGQARIRRKMAGLHWEAGDRDVSLANLQSALNLIGDDGDPVERGHLCHEMGRLAFRSGDSQAAIEWSMKALDAVTPSEDRATATTVSPPGSDSSSTALVMAEAYNTIGVARARLGDFADAVADVERGLDVANANDFHAVACRAYTNLGVLYGTLDPGRAIEVCQRGLAVATKIGDLAYQSRLYANLGVSYCTFTGRCEGEGVDAVRRAIDLDRQLGLVDHLPVSLIALGQIYQCHGQPQMAIEFYEEALEIAEDSNEPQILFPCYDGLATVHLDIDDMTGAEKYMEQAQAVCERAGLDPDSLVVMPFLC